MTRASCSLKFPSSTRLLAGLTLGTAALLSLSGCGSTTVAPDPLKLAQDANLKPVVVSVTANTGEISGFDQITVQRLSEAQLRGESDAKETFVLKLIAPGLSRDTTFFAGSLPRGEYRFYTLNDTKTKKFLSIPEKGGLLGNFVVKGDKPVDLGRLVVTPINTKVLYGRSVSTGPNRSLLQRFAPEYARLLTGEVDTGWKAPAADALPPGAVESYATARPVGASCVTELGDGRVVAASRLSTVLLRSPSGSWSALRGPGIETLSCVSAPGETAAELVAVGEFNTLLRKPAGMNKLVQVDIGNLPPGNILRLYGNSKAGWFLTLKRGNDITFFQSASLEAGNWAPIRKETLDPNAAGTLHTWPTADGFAYVVPGAPIRFYNFATKAWTERSTPDNRRISGVSPSPTGALLVLTSPVYLYAGSAFDSVFISKDQAQSWQPLEAPYKRANYTPVQLVDGTLLMPTGPELQVSKDEGRTWTHLSKYAPGRLVTPLRSGALIDNDFGGWGLFDIRYSGDGGKTWVTEYSNFDLEAYRNSQKK
jgi:hypothetical protein